MHGPQGFGPRSDGLDLPCQGMCQSRVRSASTSGYRGYTVGYSSGCIVDRRDLVNHIVDTHIVDTGYIDSYSRGSPTPHPCLARLAMGGGV